MLDQEEFEIGNVKFRIGKLSALNGWSMLERIRFSLSKTDIATADIGDGEIASMQVFAKVVLGLDPDLVNDLRHKLFAHVEFKTEAVERGWMPLKDAVDMAFAELEPSAIYEVLVRALIVNFTPSFNELVSRLKVNGLNFQQSKP